jgi:hypothetical protein
MGTCYTYLLYDEWNWSFRDNGKEEIIESIKSELPVAGVLSTWSNWIVVDLDKNSPWGENVRRLKKYCDGAYYYTDTSIWDLKKVEFKQTKEDKIIEDNKPANRNAKYIEEANKEWLKSGNYVSKLDSY